jgi:hypothetical protein
MIASIWEEILKVPRVSTQDNFFDIGGHSLLTVRVHARLRAALTQPLSLTDLFRFPTIRALAQHLGAAGPAANVIEESVDRADLRRQSMLRRRRGGRGPDASSQTAHESGA